MKNICPAPVKEPIVAKKIYNRRLTQIKLKCGHVFVAINPVGDSHTCHFCTSPTDKGLMKLERLWTLVHTKRLAESKPTQEKIMKTL